MSLACNISLFVNFDQVHERNNLKVPEKSVNFAVFSGFSLFFQMTTVEIEKSEIWQVKAL